MYALSFKGWGFVACISIINIIFLSIAVTQVWVESKITNVGVFDFLPPTYPCTQYIDTLMTKGVCVGTTSNCEYFTSNEWSNLDNQLSAMNYTSSDFNQGAKEYNSASGLVKTALAFAVIVCVTALASAFHAIPVIYFEKLQWACFGLLILSMLLIAIALSIANIYNPISDYDFWIPLLCAPSIAVGETWFDNHLFIGPGYVMALLCFPVDLWMIQILLWPGTCCGCCCCQSIQDYFRYKEEENTYFAQGENANPVVVGVIVGTPVVVVPNTV